MKMRWEENWWHGTILEVIEKGSNSEDNPKSADKSQTGVVIDNNEDDDLPLATLV